MKKKSDDNILLATREFSRLISRTPRITNRKPTTYKDIEDKINEIFQKYPSKNKESLNKIFNDNFRAILGMSGVFNDNILYAILCLSGNEPIAPSEVAFEHLRRHLIVTNSKKEILKTDEY